MKKGGLHFLRGDSKMGKPYKLLGCSVALVLPPAEAGGYSQETPMGFFMHLPCQGAV
jgi:hypothetical protein